MNWKLAGYAKWAARLLLTEMLLPGGTLVVLGLLLARCSSPAAAGRLRSLVPFQWKDARPGRGGDLMAAYAMRRLE